MLRHLAEHNPSAAVFLASLAEACARLEFSLGETIPLCIRKALVPERLGLRTYGHILTKALQLIEIAGVDKLIVLPLCRWLFDVHGHKIKNNVLFLSKTYRVCLIFSL